jgi:hypothetical protein
MAISRPRSIRRCCYAAAGTSPISPPIYRRFVAEVVGRANAGLRKALDIERPLRQPLPNRRTTDHEEALVTVTRNGGCLLRKVFYTVPRGSSAIACACGYTTIGWNASWAARRC